jgi:predicted alpha/beta superfamily hydrolase
MEYAPNKPLAYTPDTFRIRRQEEFHISQAYSDEYLRFIVQELKPAVDSAFRTRPHRNHTFIMGSSMGGLISLYALLEYPQVFGGAGCISTHWPLSLRYNDQVFTTAMLRYMHEKLPQRRRPRIYFDYGTATLDALYEPSQLRVDSLMNAHRYTPQNWMTRKFPGAEHNEKAWQQRIDVPLRFLLGQ